MALQMQPVNKSMADLDHLFSDSDDLADLAGGKPDPKKKEVKSYSDISAELMTMSAGLPSFTDPYPFTGDLCFVPESESSGELEAALKEFCATNDAECFARFSSLSANIEGQILILKSLKGPIEDRDFANLDPRVASL